MIGTELREIPPMIGHGPVVPRDHSSQKLTRLLTIPHTPAGVEMRGEQLLRAGFLVFVVLSLQACGIFALLASDEQQMSGSYVSTFVNPANSAQELKVELDLDGESYTSSEFVRPAGSTNADWVQQGAEDSGTYDADLRRGTISFTPEMTEIPEPGLVSFDPPLLILRFDKNEDGDYEDERETTVYYDIQ